VPDALAREGVDAFGERRAGREPLGLQPLRRIAIPGGEAEEAQDAQVILADALCRIAHEAQPALREIPEPQAQRIQHGAIGLGVKRVHGEVAPRRVLLQPLGEGHGGAAPVRLHIAAEGGDLMRKAFGDQGHGAMLDPRWHAADPCGARQLHHAGGQGIGGDVDIGDLRTQTPVAHTAADEEAAMPGARQKRQHALHMRRRDPGGAQPHGAIRSLSARRIRAVAPQM
jgi:hypothetical protein